jgi:hypothetical protein
MCENSTSVLQLFTGKFPIGIPLLNIPCNSRVSCRVEWIGLHASMGKCYSWFLDLFAFPLMEQPIVSDLLLQVRNFLGCEVSRAANLAAFVICTCAVTVLQNILSKMQVLICEYLLREQREFVQLGEMRFKIALKM